MGGDIVFERKQVLPIASIALVCFLIGTSVASDGGNPFDMLWEAVQDLQSQIDEIELTPGPTGPIGPQGPQGPPGGFDAPDYDSGWISIAAGDGVEVRHELGTSNVFVYLVGRITPGGALHQYGYGEDRYVDSGIKNKGVYWFSLTTFNIWIVRGAQDTFWEQFRLRLWIIS